MRLRSALVPSGWLFSCVLLPLACSADGEGGGSAGSTVGGAGGSSSGGTSGAGGGVGGAVSGGGSAGNTSGGGSAGTGGTAGVAGDAGADAAADASVCTLTKPYSSKNAACNACAEKECCAAINVCYASSDCDDGYVNCILACALLPGDAGDAGVADCLSDCDKQYPKGKAEYDAAIGCADTMCAGPCG